MAAAGALAGLPARSAQACDNDRYPCPVVAQPQEADAAVRPPQSRKKASRAARQDEKAAAKAERQSAQTPSQANPATPEQAADAGSRRLGPFVPMPPAPARVNRMQRLRMARQPSRRVG
jgi:hypothetical protein